MTFSNLESILACMKDWEQIRNNPEKVIEYLGKGNYFPVSRNKPEANNLHAYPGIDTATNEFYIFLIDAQADRNSSPIDLFNAITVCQVKQYHGNTHEIPELIARKRIDEWGKRYQTWAADQINFQIQTQGIFKAFNIPSSYIMRGKPYSTFFGLKQHNGSATGYDADLISVDSSTVSKVYYDTVRPVPPFDVLPQSSFYLLSMI